MPRRDDIRKILLIGSGPIIISQACEFDYSGAQACKALREEGYEVVLVNSNPATIMTDPTMADRTYLEPLTPEVLTLIIEKERPDALLPTLGGQTGLNLAMEVSARGVLDTYGVQMIGADREAIHKAEDREAFKQAMQKIGLDLPHSGTAHTLEEAERIAGEVGFPCIIRPAFTLGGTGGGTAYNIQELRRIAASGLEASAVTEILVEESIIGWKEFELEVMRDRKDNVVIICSIENLDPMGVHTGDSITVAPAQTLADKEYQKMRDAALACIREIGVETGGSNVQFALNPRDGRMVVIEMNPRVSRSSALASKATGFPIAKIAAKLAVGYTLDEIPNDITRETPASFEPTIDYCVVKIPRFAFEKFPESDPTLGISMKSVGEVMAIGRTFQEALGKGVRSLETGRIGLLEMREEGEVPSTEELEERLRAPCSDRIFDVAAALRQGLSEERVAELTFIDPWFLRHIKQLVSLEGVVAEEGLSGELLEAAKRSGFSDRGLARLTGREEDEVRRERLKAGLRPAYKLVDTCAAEFEAVTPYYYSSYEPEDEVATGAKEKIMILGGGPNRIGQGIEFDYCCVHASFALRELGYETIMVNSNPETVSTDYDISDRLYFEPLTLEDVLAIVEKEEPKGVIVQFGGQTPLKLAVPLARAGVPIIGTSPDSIDLAEDRKRFGVLLDELGIPMPANGMSIVYDRHTLEKFAAEAFLASEEHPILIDQFLEDAVEVDVDALADGERVIIGGIMEHIEEAGIHSGDSACVLPPYTLDEGIIEVIRVYTRRLAEALNVVGLMNIQYAVKNGKVYVLEVNPRASRTAPFVSKATGLPLAKIAAKVMAGKRLADLGVTREVHVPHYSVKESVFPFSRFPGVDPVLGPEMKSTGEVMGIDPNFGLAYVKSQFGAGQNLPTEGTVFISVLDRYKERIVPIARRLSDLGFSLVATAGTAQVIEEAGVPVDPVRKVHEGRPNVVDLIKNRQVHLVINTPRGRRGKDDQIAIRREALMHQIPTVTTVPGASAVATGLESLIRGKLTVKALQDYHDSTLF
jgi:carbamoyl-phosphate synthase large subunit